MPGRTVVAVCDHDGGIGAKLTADHDELRRQRHRARMVRGPAPRPDRCSAARRSMHAGLERFDLLDGLGDAELAAIELALNVRTVEAGTTVIREGEVADEMFFLLAGAYQRGAPARRPRRWPQSPARHARAGRRVRRDGAARRGAPFGRRRVRRAVDHRVALTRGAAGARSLVSGHPADDSRQPRASPPAPAATRERADPRAGSFARQRQRGSTSVAISSTIRSGSAQTGSSARGWWNTRSVNPISA